MIGSWRARRATFTSGLRQLLDAEVAAERRAAASRLRDWPLQQLVHEGITLLRLRARSKGNYFAKPVVRLEPRRAANGRLPYHRFLQGDMVRAQAMGSHHDRFPRDGVVLRRTPYFLDLVMRQEQSWPRSVLWRLDRSHNEASYERMLAALQRIRKRKSGPGHPPRWLQALLFADWETAHHLNHAAAGDRASLSRSFASSLRDGVRLAWLHRIHELRQVAHATSGTLTFSKERIHAILHEIAASGLNSSQQAACLKALLARTAIIRGPPGTGKTRTAVQLIRTWVSLPLPDDTPPTTTDSYEGALDETDNNASSLGRRTTLAVTASNVAADQLLAGLLECNLRVVRVGDPARVRAEFRDCTLTSRLQRDPRMRMVRECTAEAERCAEKSCCAARVLEKERAARRQGTVTAISRNRRSPGRTKLRQSGGDDSKTASLLSMEAEVLSWREKSLQQLQKAEEEEKRIAHALLEEADVIVGTCVGAGVEALDGFQFGLVVIDEASQSHEGETLIPLSRLHPEVGQLVMLGDEQQLPPTVQSPTSNRLQLSLFERLVARTESRLQDARNGMPDAVPEGGMDVGPAAPVLSMLYEQFRMHPTIAACPSDMFYGGKLQPHPGTWMYQRPAEGVFPWPKRGHGVAFVPVMDPAGERTSRFGGSCANVAEAEAVVSIVRLLLQTEDNNALESPVPSSDHAEETGISPLHEQVRQWMEGEGEDDTAMAWLQSVPDHSRDYDAVEKADEAWELGWQADLTNSIVAEQDSKLVSEWNQTSEDPWFPEPRSIGIISPYAAQVRLLVDTLRAAGIPATEGSLEDTPGDRSPDELELGDEEDDTEAAWHRDRQSRGPHNAVEVKTVDGFQGREKDVIIVSAVRSNDDGVVGFLKDARRLNVSLTRARCGLIVLGDPETLRTDATWAKWLQWIAKEKLLVMPNDISRALEMCKPE